VTDRITTGGCDWNSERSAADELLRSGGSRYRDCEWSGLQVAAGRRPSGSVATLVTVLRLRSRGLTGLGVSRAHLKAGSQRSGNQRIAV
jgi:hypothetical protein